MTARRNAAGNDFQNRRVLSLTGRVRGYEGVTKLFKKTAMRRHSTWILNFHFPSLLPAAGLPSPPHVIQGHLSKANGVGSNSWRLQK
jgi:hypothetical protein